jgi:hypothetical protein
MVVDLWKALEGLFAGIVPEWAAEARGDAGQCLIGGQ